MSEENRNKKKFPLWMYPETRKLVADLYEQDNCQSQSEFIEKAIKFYCGFITSKTIENYMLKSITSALTGLIRNTEDHLAKMEFKTAVELSKLAQIIAYAYNIPKEEIDALQAKCVDEVRRINGAVKFEDAYRYQREC